MRSAVAVVARPDLWRTALRVVLRLAPRGWWRRAPHLPLPDRGYWEFRATTAFGSGGAAPDPHDVVTYLEWCRAWPAVTGR